MTDTSRSSRPGGDGAARRSEPGGFGLWFRLFVLAAIPTLLLAGIGVLLVRSPELGGPALEQPLVESYFLIGLGVALVLAGLLAGWIQHALRTRLWVLRRALGGGRGQDIRKLARETGWRPISDLARDALELLARAHAARSEADELTRIHDRLEALTAKLEEWTATETAPVLRRDPELRGLSEALDALRLRLEERAQESRQAAVQALESAREARAAVELTSREATKSALEASSMVRELVELRRAVGEAFAVPPPAPAPAPPLPRPAIGVQPIDWAPALAGLRLWRERLEAEERRALSLALGLAAARLRAWGSELAAGRGGNAGGGETAPPGQSLAGVLAAGAGGLRELALGFRTLGASAVTLEREIETALVREVELALERETTLALESAAAAEAELSEAESGPSGPAASEWREILAARFAELERRGDRLAALSDRAERHALHAARLAQGVEEDVSGVGARLEAPQPPNDAPPDPTGAPEDPPGAAWKMGGPLRLLTREDVVPEAAGAPPPESARADAASRAARGGASDWESRDA